MFFNDLGIHAPFDDHLVDQGLLTLDELGTCPCNLSLDLDGIFNNSHENSSLSLVSIDVSRLIASYF